MGVKCSMYYSTFREEKGNYLMKLPKFLPEGWTLDVVFRYKYKGLDDPDTASFGKFYLYENFRDLSEQEIAEAEKLVETPFALIRLMAKTAFLRYPDMRNLPDDRFLANCAYAWAKFFRENKIDMYMAGLIDESSGIVGLEVAKKLGIPIVMMHCSRFTSTFFMCDGYYQPIFWKDLSAKEIDAKYEEARAEIMGEKIINPHVVKVASSTFNLASIGTIWNLASAVPRNFYTYHVKIPAADRKLWYSTEELAIKQVKYFIRSNFAKIYMNRKPIEGEKFVFFPLHFTDDAALTAKFAIDSQFELIEKIAKILPHDTYIYVKPHPHWRGCDIPLGTMQRLAKLPKVRLLHYSTDTKKLVKNAQFTVIINSAVGFEALLAGKPVVAFGPDYPPDIVPRVRHVTEIFEAAQRKIPADAIRKYVANMRAHSFPIDPSVFATAEISEDKDIPVIVEHFKAAYEAIKSKKKR